MAVPLKTHVESRLQCLDTHCMNRRRTAEDRVLGHQIRSRFVAPAVAQPVQRCCTVRWWLSTFGQARRPTCSRLDLVIAICLDSTAPVTRSRERHQTANATQSCLSLPFGCGGRHLYAGDASLLLYVFPCAEHTDQPGRSSGRSLESRTGISASVCLLKH